MELRQMQYFLCLAEEKNVTRAARQLNIVQPALSMQIAKLEAELGQKLFDRSVQGMTLTIAGEALARLVAPIVRDAEYARQEMARLDGASRGRVSVGLITSVAQSTMASSSATVARSLSRNHAVGLRGLHRDADRLGATPASSISRSSTCRAEARPLAAHHVMDEEMVFACRKDARSSHRPTSASTTSPISIWSCPPSGTACGMILDEHAAAAGIELRPRLELDTLPALCDVIATTDFATVLPTIALQQSLASGAVRAHRFAEQRISRSIAWVHHPRRMVSAAAKAVLDIISHDLAQAAAVAREFVEPASRGRKRRRKTIS